MNLIPLVVSVCLALPPQPTTALQVELSFSKAVTGDAFSGRVFVIASKGPINEKSPPPGANWFKPYPFFAQEVKEWSPDTALAFRPQYGLPKRWQRLTEVATTTPARGAIGFLSKWLPEKYYLQAILDRDLGGMHFNSSPGNAYSKPVMVDLNLPSTSPIKLVIDRVIAEKKLVDEGRVKYVELESKLLSDFHKKPIKLRAGVVVPKFYDKDPDAKYPVIYEVPGFNGTHAGARFAEGLTEVAGVEMLYVILDPSCRLGHHVFADSDNNGPYGKALVEELIPHIEAKFRTVGAPAARFVTGHSSGGWSSLWLQVTYPDFFGGTWSTAPDPVDFRDFQRVNIYDRKQNL